MDSRKAQKQRLIVMFIFSFLLCVHLQIILFYFSFFVLLLYKRSYWSLA